MTVLNPSLYQLLSQHFGDVKVCRQGEKMQCTQGRDPRTGSRRLQVLEHGETYCINCPFCGDRRKRLYLPYLYGQPDVLHGGYRMTYFGICFNQDCLRDPKNRQALADRLFGMVNRNARPQIVAPLQLSSGGPETRALQPKGPPGLVLGVTELPETHPAVRYLTGRGFSLDTLRHYRVGYCVEASRDFPQIQGRIVIPFWFEGEYVGWQARALPGDASGAPKYYTCPGMPKSRLLYNLDNARRCREYLVIVEGVTDVWAVGDCAVALLGKTMGPLQKALIQRHWPRKPVFVLLDHDAGKEAEKIEAALSEVVCGYANRVEIVALPPGMDPGSYPRESVQELLVHAAGERGVRLAASCPDTR